MFYSLQIFPWYPHGSFYTLLTPLRVDIQSSIHIVDDYNLLIDQHKHFLSTKMMGHIPIWGRYLMFNILIFHGQHAQFLTIQSVADGPLQGLPVAPNAALSAERSWRRSVLRNRDLLSWTCGYLHDMSVIIVVHYITVYTYICTYRSIEYTNVVVTSTRCFLCLGRNSFHVEMTTVLQSRGANPGSLNAANMASQVRQEQRARRWRKDT